VSRMRSCLNARPWCPRCETEGLRLMGGLPQVAQRHDDLYDRDTVIRELWAPLRSRGGLA
jgi:hypothetical protein